MSQNVAVSLLEMAMSECSVQYQKWMITCVAESHRTNDFQLLPLSSHAVNPDYPPIAVAYHLENEALLEVVL